MNENIIKKIASTVCFFSGVSALMPSLFYIFFDIYYKTPFIQSLLSRGPWLLISIILIVVGTLLLKKISGKLNVFIKSFLINFIILNIFQIILLGIEIVRYANENISEDLVVAFFSYSLAIFTFCIILAALKVAFKLSDKYLAPLTIALGAILVIEVILKLGYNYWTFFAFAVLTIIASLVLKKRAIR
jgi:hypothetical protein